MTRYLFILPFICLTLINWGQIQKGNDQSKLSGNNNQVSIDKNYKTTKVEAFQISSIIFGIYCGECDNHCATMFKYSFGDNSKTLLVDSTDGYFKNKGNVIFDKSINDIKRIRIAQSIFNKIPNQLLTTNKLSESFGCPDCTDGCGIYFEIKQGGRIKKFYIDNQTGQLTGEMKEFAEFLRMAIAKLKG
ncbi:hypothetical protein [Hymenobacter perfusus]|uniref:Uncharacterized protein n=1 Tax=Hymenobacter perfusus TaxID=1236770 RepID=A0A428K773_9BACT|nr:hypothetical protein [Hymenobacter perfusus]RSK42314.1 hypothetical protein EI293_15445 [Hymenobacter perfusus]